MIYTVCVRADLFVEVSAKTSEAAMDTAVAALSDMDAPILVENDPAALPEGIVHARVWPWLTVHCGQPEAISVESTRDENEEATP